MLGVPSVSIMTDAFVGAAELMARVLGAEGHGFVTVPHPISSADDADLVDAARTATRDCARILTAAGSGPVLPNETHSQ